LYRNSFFFSLVVFLLEEKEKMIVKSKGHRSGGAQDKPLGSYIFVKNV